MASPPNRMRYQRLSFLHFRDSNCCIAMSQKDIPYRGESAFQIFLKCSHRTTPKPPGEAGRVSDPVEV